MNELEKRESAVQRHLQRSNLSLAERFKQRQSVQPHGLIALDFSSSMNNDIEPGTRRIDALKSIMKDIVFNGKILRFDSDVQEITRGEISDTVATGSTNMVLLFLKIKELGFSEALVITDGKPTSNIEATLKAAEGLKIRIMYVGSGEYPEFLQKLANLGGSFCTKEDLRNTKQLTEKIQLLLSSVGF